MNGRVYDPLVAQFLSPDTFIADMANSLDYNRYMYARNNPLIYTDPSGEFVWTIITAVADFIGKGFFQGGFDFTASKEYRQNVWRNYDPTAPWSNTNKAWKIDIGYFKPDENKNFWGRLWEGFSRHSWQSLQTNFGYVASGVQNLFGGVRSVTNYGGATVVEMYGENWGAITFGNYILGNRGIQADLDNALFQHEYGHYLQSQAYGPYYFQRYGLPSAFSKGNHRDHPVEQDANLRSLKYFNKYEGFESFDEQGRYTGRWRRNEFSILDYDWNQPYYSDANSTARKNAWLKPSWYDWTFGPNTIISSWINVYKLNRKNR